jgi:hypothetical protein
MYREAPHFEGDSGWRFLSGRETPDYAGDWRHFPPCDVNVVANRDPEIVSLLSVPAPAAFARSAPGEALAAVEPPPSAPA